MKHRNRLGFWLAAVVPFTLLALAQVRQGPRFDEEDYAQYLLHAQAIVDGHGFTETGVIRTRLSPQGGPRARPPGYPLMIAPFVALDGMGSPLIPLFGVACGIAFIALAGRTFATREPTSLAIAVVLLSGLQPNVLHFTSQPLSDLPFAALVWAVILLCQSEAPFSTRRLVAITLLGAAAIVVRLPGIALIPAMGAYGLLRFQRDRFRPLLPVLAWIGVFWMVTSFLPTTEMPAPEGTAATRSIVRSLLFTVRTYGYAVLDAQLYPTPIAAMNWAYHVATLVLLGVGVVSATRSNWRSFVGLFGFSYASMLVLLPVRDLRYFYPLIPIVVFLTLYGLFILLRQLRPAWPEARASAVTVACATLVAIGAGVSAWTAPRSEGITSYAEVKDLYTSLQGLPATPERRVMIFRPSILTLETGIPAMGFVRGSPVTILREMCAKRITFVVVGDLGSFPRETEALRQVVAAYPGVFDEAHRNASFTVWRFDAAGAGAALSTEGDVPQRCEERVVDPHPGPGIG